jgi:predicted dinucleotide-binding enzyme
MKTAIIGLGNIGTRVATVLTNGGQDIIVSDRNPAKAREFAAKLGSRAKATSIDEAVKEADVVILAIWFDAIREFVTAHHAALAGKIVVDPSNPITPDGKGGFKKTVPAEQSAGKINAALLPEGAELVKAFGTLGASRWALRPTVLRSAPCCSMRRTIPKQAGRSPN